MIEFLNLGANLLDSVLGGVLQGKANKQNLKMNRENLAAAYEMQNRNFQFQRDMFDEANEYNSPVNQRKLYEAAGLNPYAMMGQGSFVSAQQQTGGSASPSGNIPVESYQPNFGRAAQSFYDDRIKAEQLENLKYQNDMKQTTYLTELQSKIEDIMQKRVKTEEDYVLLRLYRSQLRVQQASERYQISQNRADYRLAEERADEAQWNNDYIALTSNLDYAIKNAQMNQENQRYSNLQEEGRNLVETRKNLRQERATSEALRQNYIKSAKKAYEEIQLLWKQRKYTDRQIEQIEDAIITAKPEKLMALLQMENIRNNPQLYQLLRDCHSRASEITGGFNFIKFGK